VSRQVPFSRKRSSLDSNPSAFELPCTRCVARCSLSCGKLRDREWRARPTSGAQATNECQSGQRGPGESSDIDVADVRMFVILELEFGLLAPGGVTVSRDVARAVGTLGPRLLPGLVGAPIVGPEIVDQRDASAKGSVDDARREVEAQLVMA